MIRNWSGVGGDENVPCILAQNRMHNKSKETRLINDQIWEYLYSWQWRHNVGKDLWSWTHSLFRGDLPLCTYLFKCIYVSQSPFAYLYLVFNLYVYVYIVMSPISRQSRPGAMNYWGVSCNLSHGNIDIHVMRDMCKSSKRVGLFWNVSDMPGYKLSMGKSK